MFIFSKLFLFISLLQLYVTEIDSFPDAENIKKCSNSSIYTTVLPFDNAQHEDRDAVFPYESHTEVCIGMASCSRSTPEDPNRQQQVTRFSNAANETSRSQEQHDGTSGHLGSTGEHCDVSNHSCSRRSDDETSGHSGSSRIQGRVFDQNRSLSGHVIVRNRTRDSNLTLSYYTSMFTVKEFTIKRGTHHNYF